MAPFPRAIGQLPGGRLVTLDHFDHGRGGILSLLEQTTYSGCEFAPLHVMLLPELPPVGLRNASPTVMVTRTALLLTDELTAQQRECGHGPMLIESTGLTVFPTFLKPLA